MEITEIQENQEYYEFIDKDTGIKYSLPFEERGTISLYVLRSLPDRVRRQVVASMPSNNDELRTPVKIKKNKKGHRSIRLKSGEEIPYARSKIYTKKRPQQKLLNKSLPNSQAVMIPDTVQVAKPTNIESNIPFAKVTANIDTVNAVRINGEAKSRKTRRRSKKKGKTRKKGILSKLIRSVR